MAITLVSSMGILVMVLVAFAGIDWLANKVYNPASRSRV